MSAIKRLFLKGSLRWRALLLLLALGISAIAIMAPHVEIPRSSFRYQVVIDITQSMNAKDYHLEGWPETRLEFAKAAVERAFLNLPCGSEVGLGLFTTQSVQLLFEPIEICKHLPVVLDTLRHLDWRMAWSADSHVESGIYHALRELTKSNESTRLVFMTDGQETPPQTYRPGFDQDPRQIRGLLVGVGGKTPVSVPRYDQQNQLLGVWDNADIEKPPLSNTVYSTRQESRVLPTEGTYLSWMDEDHLREIATVTGLEFRALKNAEDLTEAMLNPAYSEYRPSWTDLRPWLGGLALTVLILTWSRSQS